MCLAKCNRILPIVMCLIVLGLSGQAYGQVSSTEQAVMDKIVKLKGEIDQVMMKPGASSDPAAMERVVTLKKEMDTFLALLPAHLQAQVQKKMGQSSGSPMGGVQGGIVQAENLPFVMTPQDVEKVEMALMGAQINSLQRIGVALRQGGTLNARTQGMWVALIESVDNSGMDADVGLMTKYVMREAYAKENEGLETLSGKVRFHRDMREKLQEEIARVKKATDSVSGADGPLAEGIQKKTFGLGLDGGVAVQNGDVVNNKADAMAYLGELEKELAKTNEHAETASLALEKELLQKQAKLKTMSDMSETLKKAGQEAMIGN